MFSSNMLNVLFWGLQQFFHTVTFIKSYFLGLYFRFHLFVKLHFHNIIRLSNSCEVRMKHQVMFFHALFASLKIYPFFAYLTI